MWDMVLFKLYSTCLPMIWNVAFQPHGVSFIHSIQLHVILYIYNILTLKINFWYCMFLILTDFTNLVRGDILFFFSGFDFHVSFQYVWFHFHNKFIFIFLFSGNDFDDKAAVHFSDAIMVRIKSVAADGYRKL